MYYDEYHISVPGMCYIKAADGALMRAYFGTILNDYLNIDTDGYLGVFIRSSTAKEFSLVREYSDRSSDYRFIVRCYDANMNIIGDAETYYIKGSYWFLTWDSDMSAYTVSATTKRDIFFHVDDAVKYVFIGSQGPTRSFAVYANEHASAFTPYDAEDGPAVGVEAPSVGTHLIGRRLPNAEPAPGSPIAWICTVSGTLDSIDTTCTADDTAVVEVADATGLDVGQFIKINDGAALRILSIDGTSITMSVIPFLPGAG